MSFYWTFGRGWEIRCCSQIVITQPVILAGLLQVLIQAEELQECCCLTWQKLPLVPVLKDGRKMLFVQLLVIWSTTSHSPDHRENFFCTSQSSLSNVSLEWDLRFFCKRSLACSWMCRGSHLPGTDSVHVDLIRRTGKIAVELRAVPKDLKPKEQTYVGKYKKYFIVVKCINLMYNSNQIRLWALAQLFIRKCPEWIRW